MRNLAILFLLSCTYVSWSQDSTMHEKTGIISSVRQKLNTSTSGEKIHEDSLKRKLALDSIKLSMDSLQRTKWSSKTANQKYDSIQQLLEGQDKITSITDTITKLVNKPIDKTKSFTDSLRQKSQDFLQRRLDSVQQRLDKPLDKVNSKISSIEKPIEQKVDGVNQAIDQKTDKLQTNIQKGFDKATDGTVKSPVQGLDAGDLNLPGSQSNIQGADISNPTVPGLDTELQGIKIPTESLKIPETKLNADQLKGKANLNIPEADNVKDLKGEMGEVDSKLKEVGKYEKDLQGLKKVDSASIDNLAKQAEDKVADLEQVKGIHEQQTVLTKQQVEYKAMMQRYQDKKLLKDEIARKSRNVVNGKIDKLAPAFKEAQEKMAKAKKLNADVEKYKDGKIMRVNEMKAKPVHERVVPGITLQAYNKDVFTIDWGMQIGYKLTNRLLTGAGGVYRISVSDKYPSWVKSPGIYGYRVYTDFNLLKGFYAHGEFESLHSNTFVDPKTNVEVNSHQTYSGYFGIGKRYDISKKIRGSAIVLYRAEFEGDLPSMSKINLRIGFDYNMKKRTKVKPTLSSSK